MSRLDLYSLPPLNQGANEAVASQSNRTDEVAGEAASSPAPNRYPSARPPSDSGGEDYGYGPPPTVARESNFISDSDLLLWLAEKQDGMYGELRDLMDMSRSRSKLIDDLTHLQATIDGAESSDDVVAEMNKVLERYAGTPFEGEVRALLEPLRDEAQALNGLPPGANAGVDHLIDNMSDIIKGKAEALGRDDQLQMIKIQSLTADIREASQLTSNLMASSAQASNTIVGNIRG